MSMFLLQVSKLFFLDFHKKVIKIFTSIQYLTWIQNWYFLVYRLSREKKKQDCIFQVLYHSPQILYLNLVKITFCTSPHPYLWPSKSSHKEGQEQKDLWITLFYWSKQYQNDSIMHITNHLREWSQRWGTTMILLTINYKSYYMQRIMVTE